MDPEHQQAYGAAARGDDSTSDTGILEASVSDVSWISDALRKAVVPSYLAESLCEATMPKWLTWWNILGRGRALTMERRPCILSRPISGSSRQDYAATGSPHIRQCTRAIASFGTFTGSHVLQSRFVIIQVSPPGQGRARIVTGMLLHVIRQGQ
jgi:hypothetical protein